MSVGFVIEAEAAAGIRHGRAGVTPRAGRGVAGWVRTMVLRAQANRLLRRTLRPPVQQLNLDEMPAYLRRDLGLPPNFG